MRSVVLGGFALAAFTALSASFCAHAADLGAPPPTPSGLIPATHSWTGVYLGVETGAGFGNAAWNDAFSPGVTATVKPSGFLAGIYGGVNYQIGSFVLGVDADFASTWIKGDVIDAPSNNLDTDVFWTSTITGRFGFAFDRLLLYFKGGGAFTYDRATETLPGLLPAAGSAYRLGWTVGGGLEYAFTEEWIGRLEYDYLGLADNAVYLTDTGATTTGAAVIGLHLSEVKAGVAYKF